MSHMEWSSSNRRGRLLIYSDDMIQRFDKLSGELHTRVGNVMIVHEDHELDQRRIIVAEGCIIWEVGRHVYMTLEGRRTIYNEPLSTQHEIPIARRNRRPIPIGVYDY